VVPALVSAAPAGGFVGDSGDGACDEFVDDGDGEEMGDKCSETGRGSGRETTAAMACMYLL
jgi:hypothetical protein